MQKNKRNGSKISDLKTGVEKKENASLIKKEKELKPGTMATLKTLRTIFWIVFCIIIVVGTAQILRSKQPRIIENTFKYQFNESESEKAKAVAESFVRDYLTYGGINESVYNEKMSRYINGNIIVGKPQYASGSSTVTGTMIWKVEILSPTHSNIIVKADLKIVNEKETEEKYNPVTGNREQMPIETEKVYYVSIPIFAQDGKVIINDYPIFVSAEEKLDADMESYYGKTSVMDNEKKEIKKTLEDFFDVYYSGTEGQIKTFFETDPKLKGLNGEFLFKDIISLDAYKEGETITAVAIVTINQSDLGSEFNQRFLIELKKAEDRWVIIAIENRGSKVENKEE